jgi:hypothetical protein
VVNGGCREAATRPAATLTLLKSIVPNRVVTHGYCSLY